jgi:hypothetical protein
MDLSHPSGLLDLAKSLIVRIEGATADLQQDARRAALGDGLRENQAALPTPERRAPVARVYQRSTARGAMQFSAERTSRSAHEVERTMTRVKAVVRMR